MFPIFSCLGDTQYYIQRKSFGDFEECLSIKCLILLSVSIGILLIPQISTAQSVKPLNNESKTTQTAKGCPENPDKQYNRQQILEKFADVIYDAVPEAARLSTKWVIKNEKPIGFSIWDLTDTTNKDVAFLGECVNFVDNHIYHFIADNLPFSVSHIAILEKGNVKIFKSLICPEGQEDYKELIEHLNIKLKKDKNKNDIINRVKNFRRYHYYPPTDFPYYFCREQEVIKPNPDPTYNRSDVYFELSGILYKFVPESYRKQIGISIDRERAINFFVYDLTDPSNKQTTSIERVDFINNHVYHFAYIDAPYSYSNIAVLENGKLRVFKGINCANKGDSLEDVIKYLNEKLKNDKNKDEIIERVKNYRQYGVYTPFNGISTPQCEKLEIDQK